jgi:hypothetical protein
MKGENKVKGKRKVEQVLMNEKLLTLLHPLQYSVILALVKLRQKQFINLLEKLYLHA